MAFYDEKRDQRAGKPFVASFEFWAGVFSAFVLIALVVGLAA